MSLTSNPHECDIAIIGGGLGGVAAALAACEAGAQVILTEETPWIGGQVTSQAVSALDDHYHIEKLPGTRTYSTFRGIIRQLYQQKFNAPQRMPNGKLLNPGNGWVSRLCFEPRIGLKTLTTMLTPHMGSGRLRLFLGYRPVQCEGDPTHIRAIRLERLNITAPGDQTEPGSTVTIHARYYLDASELGDLLPLANIPYVTGAEAWEDTHEPHASRDGPHPERVQSFTFCFLVKFCPGEDHTIRKPRHYAQYREKQPYSLTLHNREGEALHYCFFAQSKQGLPPFWMYRRVFDASLLTPRSSDTARGATPNGDTANGDIALINWNSNDYRWGNIIDQKPEHKAAILDEARKLSLGFLYWLQTEVRRDDGNGYGYPELRLLTGAVGTRSGLAMVPYIRESRRILGLRRIHEQDISTEGMELVRPTDFPDTAGIGWYPIDLHPCVGDDEITEHKSSMYASTRPFQIPLGALIPVECDNLLASCKNIATTHLTNGAYRLHHTEWSIGEAAGSLAARCCANDCRPRAVWETPHRLVNFQDYLRSRGVTLEWPVDL